MPKNTGKEYERLTQRVFQSLHDQASPPVVVEHNIELKGIGTTHQIDVSWVFERASFTYRTIVDCKDRAAPVQQGEVFKLRTVLDDLAGQPRGAIVARNGFQEGAREFARTRGIDLYELRPPVPSDWAGYVTSIRVNASVALPVLHSVEFVLDDAWFVEERKRRNLSANFFVPVPSIDGNPAFEREDGTVAIRFDDVVILHHGLTTPCPAECREYVFPEPLYAATGNDTLERVRLVGVKMFVELRVVAAETMTGRLDALVGFILKEVFTGRMVLFDKDGKLLGRGEPRPAKAVPHDDPIAEFRDWLRKHAQRSMNDLRAAFSVVGDHPRRGPFRSYDGQTRWAPESPPDERDAWLEEVPGMADELHLYRIEGQVEDRLTLSRRSIGTATSDQGLFRALREIIGDPPGWAPTAEGT